MAPMMMEAQWTANHAISAAKLVITAQPVLLAILEQAIESPIPLPGFAHAFLTFLRLIHRIAMLVTNPV